MNSDGERVVRWRGGSLDDLVAMMSQPALAARIEVLVSDAGSERLVGEVHMVAGGVADVFAGPLRGDEAMAQLRVQRASRFRVEPCLPHPKTGALMPRQPEEGNLAERPPTTLMRYCEEFAMTCLLEVWRGLDHATISYRRGEIVGSSVDGVDSPDRLPEVMTWTSGRYRFVLPPLVLPAPVRTDVTPPPFTPAPVAQGARAQTMHGRPAPSREPPDRPARETLTLVPGPEDARRGTVPGMPVDVFDAPSPERTTDVGVPAAPPMPMPMADADLVATPPPAEPPAPRAQQAAPRVPTPTRGVRAGFPRQTHRPMQARRTAVRRRGLADLPVLVHVGLGLALGLAVVGGYWVLHSLLPH